MSSISAKSATRTFMFINNIPYNPLKAIKKSSTHFQKKHRCLKKLSVIERLHILDIDKQIKDEIYNRLLASIDVINLSILELNNSLETILFDIQKQISLHESSEFVVLNNLFDISEDDDYVNITSVVEENGKKLENIFQMIVKNYCKSALSMVM